MKIIFIGKQINHLYNVDCIFNIPKIYYYALPNNINQNDILITNQNLNLKNPQFFISPIDNNDKCINESYADLMKNHHLIYNNIYNILPNNINNKELTIILNKFILCNLIQTNNMQNFKTIIVKTDEIGITELYQSVINYFPHKLELFFILEEICNLFYETYTWIRININELYNRLIFYIDDFQILSNKLFFLNIYCKSLLKYNKNLYICI